MNISAFLSIHKKLLILLGISFSIGVLACASFYVVGEGRGLDPLRLMGDSRGYLLLAENIVDHSVFSLSNEPPYTPESFRSPGYPLFLALLLVVFGSWHAALFVQAALLSIAPVLLYLLLRPFHERAAWWGSIIFVFEPVRLFYSSVFLSDMFFTLLLLLSLLFLERAFASPMYVRWVGLSGIVLGVSILVRPIGMFLPVLYAGYLLILGRAVRRAVFSISVLFFAVLLVTGPWMVRNHTLFDSWGISSVGNANLVLYNAPEFLKAYPDKRSGEILEGFNREQKSLPREEALSLRRNSEFVQTFLTIVDGREFLYATFHFFKTVPFFLTDGLRDIVRLYGVGVGNIPNISTSLLRGDIAGLMEDVQAGSAIGLSLLVFGSSFWLVVCLLCALALYRAVKDRSSFFIFCFVLILYFAFLTGPVSNARYRLPVEGFLIVGAMGGLLALPSRFYERVV